MEAGRCFPGDGGATGEVGKWEVDGLEVLKEELKEGEGLEAMNEEGRGRGRIIEVGRREVVGEGETGVVLSRLDDLVGEGPRPKGEGRFAPPPEMDILLECPCPFFFTPPGELDVGLLLLGPPTETLSNPNGLLLDLDIMDLREEAEPAAEDFRWWCRF